MMGASLAVLACAVAVLYKLFTGGTLPKEDSPVAEETGFSRQEAEERMREIGYVQ